jgi:hypothetical protein
MAFRIPRIGVRQGQGLLTALALLGIALSARGQVNTGELRVRVTDPVGLGVKASITVSSEANQYRKQFSTSDAGEADIKKLAYGIYLLSIEKAGFAEQIGAAGRAHHSAGCCSGGDLGAGECCAAD